MKRSMLTHLTCIACVLLCLVYTSTAARTQQVDLLLRGSNYNGWNLPFALEPTIHDNESSQKTRALSDRNLTMLADPNAYFSVVIADTDSFEGSAQIDYTFYGQPEKRILVGDWFNL